jgi:hypothetical protein
VREAQRREVAPFEKDSRIAAQSSRDRPRTVAHSLPTPRFRPQAIGRAVIHQSYRVWYREAHMLLERTRRRDARRHPPQDYLADLITSPLLIIDDLGMRKLPHAAAEDLLEVIMRRYERASTLLTSNRPSTIGGSCRAAPPR